MTESPELLFPIRSSRWPAAVYRRPSAVNNVYPTGQIVDRTFAHVLAKLRCRQCGRAPAPVYLCAGHREHTMGAPPDWAMSWRQCLNP